MRAPHGFTSSLADRMVQFIAFKRMQGYDYRHSADRLRLFDAFLTECGHASTALDLDVLERFAREIVKRCRATRAGRLSGVRQFSLYLHALEPESVLLPLRLMPRESQKTRFYPLSSAQVGELMAATATLKPDNGICAECMRFLIGLLYSTGLRISEALAPMPFGNSRAFADDLEQEGAVGGGVSSESGPFADRLAQCSGA